MSGDRTIEQRISAWLEEEAVGHLPDRVLDAAFTETRAVTRRHRPFPERITSMSRSVSALVAVGAAAVIVVATVALLQRPATGVGGPPTASPVPLSTPSGPPAATPAVSPTAGPSPRIAGATVAQSGPLTAGVRYVLYSFQPPFTFVGIAGLKFIDSDTRTAGFEMANSADEAAFVEPTAVYDEQGHVIGVPSDLAAWWKGRTDVTATTTQVKLGSVTGTLVAGTLSSSAHTNTAGGVNVICWDQTANTCDFESGGQIGFLPGTRFEFLFAKVGGTQVIFEADAPPADWAAVGPGFDAFLRSISFPG